MSKKRRSNSYSGNAMQSKGEGVNRMMTRIALLLLVLCPLAFRMIRLDFISPAITNTNSVDSNTVYDTFSHIKMIILYAGSLILLCCFLYKLFATACEHRFTVYDGLALALCVLLILSFFFSQQKGIAITGFIYMLDGTLTHICFCFLFLFGFHVFSRKGVPERFMLPIYITCGINALISLLNFVGVKMIDTMPIKLVLGIPAGARATDAAAFTSTFGNINYLSGFGGICFAVFFIKLLMNQRKREFWTSLAAVAASFSIIITSLSSSGFFTYLVMVPVVLVVGFALGINKRKLFAAGAGIGVCVLLFLPLSAINPVVMDETFGMLSFLREAEPQNTAMQNTTSKSAAERNTMTDAARPGFRESTVAADRTAGPVETNVFQGRPVRHEGDSLTGRTVPLKTTGTVERSASPGTIGAAEHTASLKTTWVAEHSVSPETNGDEDFPAYSDVGGLVELPVFPEPAVAPGTGRLYIWRETVKLIRSRPFFGYGMDTITYNFPQMSTDKVSGLGQYRIFVTKPHNIFLGYAYGAGVPALLVFLLLNALAGIRFLSYLIHCRKNSKPVSVTVLCFAMAWTAYLVQGLVNDDLIATTPIWWTIFGIGLGVISRENPRKQPEKA